MVFGILNGSSNAYQVGRDILRIVDRKERAFVTRLISGELFQHRYVTFIDLVIVAQYGKCVLCLMEQSCTFLNLFIQLSFGRHWYDLTLTGIHLLIRNMMSSKFGFWSSDKRQASFV